MRACWSHSPAKRPTAVEIVELLNSNPRLVSPCIDVPLASVQIERADDVDLGTRHGMHALVEPSPSAYSPMQGVPRVDTEEELSDMRGGIGEPLLEAESYASEDMSPCVGSYVQAGYILLDNN